MAAVKPGQDIYYIFTKIFNNTTYYRFHIYNIVMKILNDKTRLTISFARWS